MTNKTEDKFYFGKPGQPERFGFDKDMMGTNKRIIRARGHEFLAEDEGNRTRISIKIDGVWEHATTVNTDNQTATEWIEANAKPGHPSRWLPYAFSRPGEPDTFAVEDRFYFGKGRKERFASKEQAIAFIKQYKRNEDSNAHSENVVLLAKFMGNSRAAKLASLVQQINEVAGHMPHGVGQFQYNELHAPLWKQFIAQYGDLYASVK